MQQATVNLFADMGAQPDTRPGRPRGSDGVDSTRNRRRPRSRHQLRARRWKAVTPSTITGSRIRQRRRRRRRRRSVDRWRRELAPRAGPRLLDLHVGPGLAGSATIEARAVDDSGNLDTPAIGSPHRRHRRTCPCAIWGDSVHPRSPMQTTRVRWRSASSSAPTKTATSPACASTRARATPARTSAVCGRRRGTLLANATFTGETASGWQEVLLPSPVRDHRRHHLRRLLPHARRPLRRRRPTTSHDRVDAPPLHALADGEAGGNGVYRYGAAGSFPNETFNATNYWVDVVFDNTPDTTAPQIANVAGTPIDSAIADVTWTTDEQATSAVDYSTDSTFRPR